MKCGRGDGQMTKGPTMRRRVLIVPLAGVLLLVAAHFAIWRYEAGQLQAGFADWLAQRRAAGWTATMGTPKLGGWPLTATLSVPDIALRGGDPDIPGGLAWSAQQLDLGVDLFAPGTLRLHADGPQHLRVAGIPVIAYTADSMNALLPLADGTPPHAISLTVRDLRAGMPDVAPAANVTIGLVQLDGSVKPAAAAGEAALTYRLSTEAIALPAVRTWPLGSRLSSFSIEGVVDGPVPVARGLVPLATAWRDGGGTVGVKHLVIGWGPLGLSGAATLALDARLQPMGTGSVHIVGYAASLDALASGHVLTASAVVAAKAVLSLLASVPEDGGPPEVEVPLTLEDRTLKMRQVPLLKLPEVIWPAP
jgi:hypothetical protein